MKQLKFYISNIDPNLLKTITGRPAELIKLIRTGEYINEKTIAQKLFTTKWSDQNYLNLKSRTKKILEAYFLISPPKKSSETYKKLQRCRKNYFLAMQCIELFKRENAKNLLKKAYKIATENSFTLMAYKSALELMWGASMERKASKFEEYNKKVKKLLLDLQAEDEVQYYYYKIALKVNSKRGLTDEMYQEFIAALDIYSCTTTKFIQFYYMIKTFQSQNALDYPEIKQNTKTALGILKTRNGVYSSILQFFTKNLAIAHTALGEYEEAKALYISAEDYAPALSFNRGVLYYYQAVNAMHSGKYQEAYQLYRQHRKTKFDTLAEQWAVMGAFMYYLKCIGRLDIGTDRFSVGKYLNETVPSTHDKTGNKINILIGELLVYLVKDRGRFIDRTEAINQYSYTHLKGTDTRRAKWFIRILCMMPRANFHPVALARMAKRQIDNLKTHPVYMGDNLAIEVIPFGDLWEMILGQLRVRVA